jgi:hypothetical protein
MKSDHSRFATPTFRSIADLLEIEVYSVTNGGKSIAAQHPLKFELAFKLHGTNPDLERTLTWNEP